MWFNNRFTKDNKIHFVPSEWICTDPDEVQFCRIISDTEFEYIQLKNGDLKEQVEGEFNALAALDGKTTINDWYQDEINVNDYDADELGKYVASYGGDEFLGDSEGAFRNQLMDECIFETDIVFSGCFDYD